MSAQSNISEADLSATADDRFDQPNRRGRPGRMPPDDSAIITRRITALAVGLGVFMGVGKFWLWGETGSVGILASLVHSALDIFGAIASFIAVRFAARKPNADYRFGFGKAESFSAVFQVCLIIMAAAHLLQEVFGHLGHSHGPTKSGPAIMVLVIFIALTLWLIIAQSWAVRATGSDERRAIKRLAMADPQVRAVTELRTRAAGPHLHLQMRLDLDETLTLSQTHDLVLATEKRIMDAFPAADVLIYPHPAGCGHAHGNVRFQTSAP